MSLEFWICLEFRISCFEFTEGLSGHSKWSTIKHQKAAEDKKRGKLFSRLSKMIAVAVREGGDDDPDNNPKLRMAIEKAREANMPKDNIKRAIDRGAGRGGAGRLETVIFEGFGPGKTAVIVECVTDNKKRTTSEVKSFMDKKGGSLGSAGSVSYLFEKKGHILVEKKSGNIEEQILDLMETDAEDVLEEGELIEVITKPSALHYVLGQVKEKGYGVKEENLFFNPKIVMPLKTSEAQEKVMKFLQGLDELEDVQEVYSNANFVNGNT